MAEYMDVRNKAKSFSDKQEWLEASVLYEQIYAPQCDKWLAWEYSRCLKYLREIDKAIKVSKELFMRDMKFTYNNDLLAWLLYEKYFKLEKDNYSYKELNDLCRITDIITKIIKQKEKSAYQLIVMKMLRLLHKHGNSSYEKMMVFIDKLDASMLSEQAGIYKEKGCEKKFCSQKELYYSYKTKALLLCSRYEECILCCDEALTTISSFHSDIDIWILLKKATCFMKLNQFDEAIILLNDTIIKSNHYSLLESLADIYLIKNEFDNALLFYCRAALTKDKPEMKVKLYYKIANILFDSGNTENAFQHSLFAIQIRNQNKWKIPNELQSLHGKLSMGNSEQEIKLFVLKDFWLSIVYKEMNVYCGTVSRINAGGKTGFIKSNKGSNFFKISSFYDKPPLKENVKVNFVLIDSFNIHKQELSKECAYIKFDKH